MGKITDFRSSAPKITGSTTINHEIRVKLGLNCSEYCMMDHLSRKEDKGEFADTLSVFISTGFAEVAQTALLKELMKKAMVAVVSGVDGKGQEIKISQKWLDAFPDIDREFEFFWVEIIPDAKGVPHQRPAWTGTKKKALEYWHKLRKKYSLEYMMAQRASYFEYLELEHKRGFQRQRMMCQVFLNPSNERYAEDYADYAKQLRIKLGLMKDDKEMPTSSILTVDKMKEAYGKNNNQ
jgi:hypothetical protein